MYVCVYIYNEILLGHKKEETRDNVDGPWRHDAKQHNSEKDKYCMFFLKKKKNYLQ